MRYVLSLLMSLSLLAACQNKAQQQQRSPETAFRGFVAAIKDLDFDLAKQYGTAQTHKNFTSLVQAGLMMKQINPQYIQDSVLWKLDSLHCQTNQGQAWCVVCCKLGQKDSIQLLEEEGLWKVNIVKELQLFQ